MKILALSGWVAALASLLVAALLFADRKPVDPGTVLSSVPYSDAPTIHLRGVKTVSVAVTLTKNITHPGERLQKVVTDALVSGGLAVVRSSGEFVPEAADGVVIVYVSCDPLPDGGQILLMKLSFKKKDVFTVSRTGINRGPNGVWSAEQPLYMPGDGWDSIERRLEVVSKMFAEAVSEANATVK